MFWKLCKHELKCSYRGFMVLYAITLLLSMLLNSKEDSFIFNTMAIVYGLLLIVIMVMSIYVIIKNYTTSMYSRSAYLTHTLPVSSTKLLLVKLLIGMVWLIVSYIVILLSVLIISLSIGNVNFHEVFRVFANVHISIDFILSLFYLLLSIAANIILLYLVIDITHTTYIQRFRVPIAIILFMLISWITSEVLHLFINIGGTSLMNVVSGSDVVSFSVSSADTTSTMIELLLLCGWEVLLTCLFFFSSKYLIDHKIEVE